MILCAACLSQWQRTGKPAGLIAGLLLYGMFVGVLIQQPDFGQTLLVTATFGALLFLDLDNFKPLNDEYGHDYGDLLLKEAARRIASCVREVDTAARFGGDEFVVVLSELLTDKAESVKQAISVAEKIRSALAEPYLLSIQREGCAEVTVEHRCTSSIGLVLFKGIENPAVEIIKWADLAMYQAKATGGDTVELYKAIT